MFPSDILPLLMLKLISRGDTIIGDTGEVKRNQDKGHGKKKMVS